MLDTYLYEGEAGIMTFTGPVSYLVAFNLILAPDADPWQRDNAAKALALFMLDARMAKE